MKKHFRAILAVESTPLWPLKTSNLVISFSNIDFKGANQNQHDPMVISVVIGNYIIQKILLDEGSLANILYISTLQKMQILESSLSPYNGDLVGFSRERVNVLGIIELRTNFGSELNIKIIGVRYLVIHSWVSYYMILGRLSLNTLGAILSTPIWH